MLNEYFIKIQQQKWEKLPKVIINKCVIILVVNINKNYDVNISVFNPLLSIVNLLFSSFAM